MIESLNGNIAVDVMLLLIGVAGLLYTFGSGNWRVALHRYVSRPRLTRLRDDSKRVAEDIANTLSQERNHRDAALMVSHDAGRGVLLSQDGRYLSKHMLEANSIIERLKSTGYWEQPKHFSEIGVAGATPFAAEETAKMLYSASEKIRCDLEDGFMPISDRAALKGQDQ